MHTDTHTPTHAQENVAVMFCELGKELGNLEPVYSGRVSELPGMTSPENDNPFLNFLATVNKFFASLFGGESDTAMSQDEKTQVSLHMWLCMYACMCMYAHLLVFGEGDMAMLQDEKTRYVYICGFVCMYVCMCMYRIIFVFGENDMGMMQDEKTQVGLLMWLCMYVCMCMYAHLFFFGESDMAMIQDEKTRYVYICGFVDWKHVCEYYLLMYLYAHTTLSCEYMHTCMHVHT
jgi:hypothetical protein